MAVKKATKKTVKQGEINDSTFAVIETGGKQYEVRVGDIVTIEKLKGDFKLGDKVVFEKVLMVDDGKDTTIGAPYIKEAKVEAKVSEIGKHEKVSVMKYKAKSRYQKIRGHRQPYFKVEIVNLK